MKYRKLRIAWSVVWGVVAVLLLVLWVRSHYLVDQVHLPIGESTAIALDSIPDAFSVRISDQTSVGATHSAPTSEWLAAARELLGRPWSGKLQFGIASGGFYSSYWIFVLLSSVLAVAPWLRRFTLRALLIATTLVAIVLGLVVWVRS